MNLLNKARQGNISIIVEKLNKEDNNNRSYSQANENSVFKANYFSGLCCNCENNIQCDWQRENKIFCEQYQ